MPGRSSPKSHQKSIAFSALTLSVGLHGALLLSLRAPLAENPPREIQAFQLLGSSFEVDELIKDGGANAQPNSQKTTQPAQLPQAREEAPQQNNMPEAEAPEQTKVEPGTNKTESEPEPVSDKNVTEKAAPHPTAASPATPAPSPQTPTSNQEAPKPSPPAAQNSDPFAALPLPGGESSSAGSDSAQGHTQTQQGNSYGSEGDSKAPVDLTTAFLKVLPLSAKKDITWTQLPLGKVGSIKIELIIDEELHLQPIRIIEPPGQTAPAVLKRMALGARAWLLTQRFALSPQKQAGRQRFVISASISQAEVDEDARSETQVRALGTRGGTPPRGAFFTYFSGRHVDLAIESAE